MVGALDFRDAVLVFDRICRFLKEAKDECSIIQIGASSGKDIVYFAKKNILSMFIISRIFLTRMLSMNRVLMI